MEFEERAVAFIDVLGFTALVACAAESDAQMKNLAGLVQLLSSAVPSFDAKVDASVSRDLVPRHIYISDCIILSAPLVSPSTRNYDGLSILVMRVIQISHYMLKAGYLVRGGISVGKVWHTESNIVGPAYQEAFLLEKNGNEPFVRLSPSAAERWQGGSRMCLRKDDAVLVNGLFDYYIPNNTKYGVIEEAYDAYESLAESRLLEAMPERAKEKWVWFREFLRAEKPEGLKWAMA